MEREIQARVQVVFYGEESSGNNEVIAYVNSNNEMFIKIDDDWRSAIVCLNKNTLKEFINHLQDQLKSM